MKPSREERIEEERGERRGGARERGEDRGGEKRRAEREGGWVGGGREAALDARPWEMDHRCLTFALPPLGCST